MTSRGKKNSIRTGIASSLCRLQTTSTQTITEKIQKCHLPTHARKREKTAEKYQTINGVLQGAPPRRRQLYFTFPSAPDPFSKASNPPFRTLRVATPSGAPCQAPLEQFSEIPFFFRGQVSSKQKGPGAPRNHTEISAQKVADFECRFPYDSYGKDRAPFWLFWGEGFWGNIRRPPLCFTAARSGRRFLHFVGHFGGCSAWRFSGTCKGMKQS